MLWPPVNCLFSFCHISEFGFPLSIEVDFQYTVIHQFYCSFMSAKVKDKIKDPGIGSVTSLLYNLDIFRIFLSHHYYACKKSIHNCHAPVRQYIICHLCFSRGYFIIYTVRRHILNRPQHRLE
nr:MAG TPA: hypothetical protein [Caudoviricetes sp.]